MNRTILVALVLAASPVLAQEVQVQAGPGGLSMTVHGDDDDTATASSSDSYRFVSRADRRHRTIMKILAPEDAHVAVFDGRAQVVDDDIPVSFKVAPDRFYRIVITVSDGQTWEKKLSVREGQIASLWVRPPEAQPVVTAPQPPVRGPIYSPLPPPPPAPMPMADSDFDSLKGAIDNESFPAQKVSVIETATSSGAYFTIAQVGQLVDLLSFPQDKVHAVELVRSRIVDRQNGFKLLSHFTFPSDKEKVKQLLSN